jgi:hypothetical protein
MKTFAELEEIDRDRHYYRSANLVETRKNWMWWPPTIVIVLALAVLLINSVSTSSSDNYGGEKHADPVPAQVVQYTDDSYLIAESAKTSPTDICKGGNSNGDAIEESKTMLNGDIYVECGADQKWSQKPTDDTNFGEAIMTTIDEPGWFMPLLGALLLSLMYPFVVSCNELLGLRRRRKAARTEQDRKKIDLEQARLELAHAFAKEESDGGLSHLDYLNAMDKLYTQGLEPAKK